MSMLSVQIDRLRSCADLYDGTTKPEMAKELQRPYLAQELRDAADTIWQLRDDLQRANAKSAKLRELCGEVASILFNLDVDRCGLCRRDDISHPCPVHTARGGECPIKGELRELGIEAVE